MIICYIYALCDPRTHEVRYIGKSVRPAYRLEENLKSAISGGPTKCHEWIRSLLDDHLVTELICS